MANSASATINKPWKIIIHFKKYRGPFKITANTTSVSVKASYSSKPIRFLKAFKSSRKANVCFQKKSSPFFTRLALTLIKPLKITDKGKLKSNVFLIV